LSFLKIKDAKGVIRRRKEHAIQWPKEKGQKDEQWSTKHNTEN
jgi:hypothetical protein